MVYILKRKEKKETTSSLITLKTAKVRINFVSWPITISLCDNLPCEETYVQH